jgi:GMP synthase-like glutamine amidotransferase
LRFHYLQHVPEEGPAYLTEIARKTGASLTGTRLYKGESTPDLIGVDLLFVLGGPMAVQDDREHSWLVDEKRYIHQALEAATPMIGICLGAQLIATVLGSPVTINRHREIGWFPVERADGAETSLVGAALPESFDAFHWHRDTFDIPGGAIRLCSSEACLNQGFLYNDRALALQFHLESTPESVRFLVDNFAHEMEEGPYVHSREEILHDQNASRLAEANSILECLVKIMVSE